MDKLDRLTRRDLVEIVILIAVLVCLLLVGVEVADRVMATSLPDPALVLRSTGAAP